MTITRPVAGKKADDKVEPAVCIDSFTDYIKHFFFLGPPRRTGDLAAITPRSARSYDPVQSTLSALVHGYNACLNRIGWNALPGWVRFIIRPLVYFGMMQMPLVYLSRNLDKVLMLRLDPGEAAHNLGISWWSVIVDRLPVVMALLFMMYCHTLICSAIFFHLLGFLAGEEYRKDFHAHPWMAASPREFWSARWNIQKQRTLAGAVYVPMCDLLDTVTASLARAITQRTSAKTSHATHSDGAAVAPNDTIKPPTKLRLFNRYVAASSVFLVSAFYHEVVVMSMAGGTDFDQTRFFCSQGAIVLAYSFIESRLAAVLPAKLMPHGRLPFIVGWPVLAISFVATGHYFFRPLINFGLIQGILENITLL
ncbi:hypothetical protein THASP1DRAFT_32863 [Thamnocephalis sphaerospora]|uniref:Wax synthase domain-containing protein n=1 Tax=Thamnocephalis sphaerospora TaxID=78915 RepID=A0A4P9XHZ6_9FUNG|nr:hypothetical protein THASP1DRAFT_32863 [Thamnocephalis sphaerospora]|eukprot:RKP05298.1 hypothetical protein THASP1DRAFT_32863 [Thamnocephalis sphaerospora]